MEDSGGVWHRIAEPGALELAPENRLHLKIDGRYVSIIKYQERLYCLDSVCFHAGGPLALGDIEELDGGKMMMPATGETTTTSEQTARDGGGKKSEKIPCLVCPWHFYHVSLRDGDKWYQAAQAGEDGKLHPGRQHHFVYTPFITRPINYFSPHTHSNTLEFALKRTLIDD